MSKNLYIAYRTCNYIEFIKYDDVMKNRGDLLFPVNDEEKRISYLLSKQTGKDDIDWIMLSGETEYHAKIKYAELIEEYGELKKPGSKKAKQRESRYWKLRSPFENDKRSKPDLTGIFTQTPNQN